jgi:hypothetical protein
LRVEHEVEVVDPAGARQLEDASQLLRRLRELARPPGDARLEETEDERRERVGKRGAGVGLEATAEVRRSPDAPEVAVVHDQLARDVHPDVGARDLLEEVGEAAVRVLPRGVVRLAPVEREQDRGAGPCFRFPIRERRERALQALEGGDPSVEAIELVPFNLVRLDRGRERPVRALGIAVALGALERLLQRAARGCRRVAEVADSAPEEEVRAVVDDVVGEARDPVSEDRGAALGADLRRGRQDEVRGFVPGLRAEQQVGGGLELPSLAQQRCAGAPDLGEAGGGDLGRAA